MVSLVVHMFAMGRASQPVILGLGREEGVGVSKNRKTKPCTRKEGGKIGTQGSMGKLACKSHLFLGFL